MSYVQKNICMDIETINRVEEFHQLMMEVDAPYFSTRKKWETWRYLLEQGLKAHEVANEQAAIDDGFDMGGDPYPRTGDHDRKEFDVPGFGRCIEEDLPTPEEIEQRKQYEALRSEGRRSIASNREYLRHEMNDPDGTEKPISEHLSKELLERLGACGVDDRDISLIAAVIRNIRPGFYTRELDWTERKKLNYERSSMILNPPSSDSEYHVSGYDLDVHICSKHNRPF